MTKGMPTMSPSALGPTQALFRGLQKQLCVHVVPQIGNSHCPSQSTTDMHLSPCRGAMAQFRSKAPEYCYRSLLPARDKKKHTKARRKPVQNPELLKKMGTVGLLVKHLKEGIARLLVKHLKDASKLPKSSGPNSHSHPLDVPLQVSNGSVVFFCPESSVISPVE